MTERFTGRSIMSELDDKLPIGAEEVAEATAILQKYKAGKAALDKRIVDNELWFRMGHWKNYQNPMMEGKPQPASGWLFNSIANKHADAMDNYPAPNVLPRAADDAQTAQVLSSILPVVLEQADYEQVYSDTWWRKLKQGTGVKGVFWDPEARGGVGEIAIRPMNLLMLYWEPGVADIQASPHFFSLSMAASSAPVSIVRAAMSVLTGKKRRYASSINCAMQSAAVMVSDAAVSPVATSCASAC